MPWSLRGACTYPGCKNLQEQGSSRCKEHQRKRPRGRDKRPNAGQRGYGSDWQRLRRTIILRDGKRCQECGDSGYLVVHHRDHDPTNNEHDNLVTMCRPCHERHHGRTK